MERFAKIKIGDKEKYYTTLKKLCIGEGLNYTNVHYAINRSKKKYYQDGNIRVDVLYFID